MLRIRNRWAGLIASSLAVSLVTIDATILNTIFPSIIESLGLHSADVQWVQESYVLVFASLLLVAGSLADRFGRRLVLILGISIFIAASFRAGFAVDSDSLVFARVFQGIGGAMVLPTTLALVNANFQGRERGIAFAIWGSTLGGMVAVGPILGGWLTTTWSWQWAFLINVPIGLLIIGIIMVFVPESKDEANESKGIDVAGAILSAVLFGFLVFTLIEGRSYGWIIANPHRIFRFGDFKWPTTGISVVAVAMAITLIAAIAFIWVERRRARAGKSVILDFEILKNRSFRNGSIAALIVSMGEFGLIFAIPLWLQNLLMLTPVETGLVLLLLAVGAFLASAIGGFALAKFKPINVVRVGLVLEIIGAIGIGLFASNQQGWISIAGWLFVYGLGVGLATAQLTNVIMADVPAAQVGQASGTQSTARQIGSALGIAVLGTIFFSGMQISIEQKVVNLQSLAEIAPVPRQAFAMVPAVLTTESAGVMIHDIENLLIEQQVPANMAADIKQACIDGFADGVKSIAWGAAGFLGLGLISTYNVGRKRRESGLEEHPAADENGDPAPGSEANQTTKTEVSSD